MTLRLGTREIDSADPRIGAELRDGSALAADARALRDRLENDGYLLLRDFHPRDEVLRARAAIVKHLAAAAHWRQDRHRRTPSPPRRLGRRT